ncbi:hypothetical protein Tco_1154160 [Tanacetum coccineum]
MRRLLKGSCRDYSTNSKAFRGSEEKKDVEHPEIRDSEVSKTQRMLRVNSRAECKCQQHYKINTGRLQVTQKDDGIFISQDKYVDEILKKFGFSTVRQQVLHGGLQAIAQGLQVA